MSGPLKWMTTVVSDLPAKWREPLCSLDLHSRAAKFLRNECTKKQVAFAEWASTSVFLTCILEIFLVEISRSVSRDQSRNWYFRCMKLQALKRRRREKIWTHILDDENLRLPGTTWGALFWLWKFENSPPLGGEDVGSFISRFSGTPRLLLSRTF